MNSVTHIMAFSDTPGAAVFSGAEHHLFTLMPAQQALGWHVSLIMLVFDEGPRLAAKAAELRQHGIEVVEVLATSRCRPLRYAQARRELTKLLADRRHTVVHTHLDHADFLGKTAARRAGCRHVVSTVHNDEPHYRRRTWKGRLHRLDKLTCHYIAISDMVRQYMVGAAGLPPAKMTTIHYGVAPPTAIQRREDLRQQLQLPPERFLIGFVGRLTEQKNLPVFLGAMRDLQQMDACIIGGGKLEAKLRSYPDRLGARNVHFLGHRDQAADLMPAFDLLCLPSKWEGLGLVLLEAMLREVPILGSRAGAIPEILGHGRFGLVVDCQDARHLAQAIGRAAEHPERLRDMAHSACVYAREHFTVDAMVRQTLAVYARVCA